MHISSPVAAFVLAALTPALAAATPQTPAGGSAVEHSARMRQLSLPLAFEPNHGQFDPRVRFKTTAGGATVFLTDREAVMVLPGKPLGDAAKTMIERKPVKRGPGAVLRMKLIGAAKAPTSAGAQRLPGIVSYFIGSDPKRWRTGVPTFQRARFAGVYPGTDLVYYGNPRRLEYDFELRPGADPGRIRLAFEGAERLRVAANGDLIATTGVGDVCWKRPFAYQMDGARRVQVACDYSLAPGSRSVAFRLARYDASRPLVVDPALLYATYLGGSGSDYGYGVTVDSAGAAYITGSTPSTNFPVISGSYQLASAGQDDAFVTKMNAAGTALTYSTYLGGSSSEYGNAIAVDSAGVAYIGGQTTSTNFPVTSGAYQRSLAGASDCFVTKLAANGTSLSYSTYVGSAYDEAVKAIAIDSNGSAYITGWTQGSAYPTTTGAFQTVFGGANWYTSSDAFVTKLNAAGSALSYSTYLGGNQNEQGAGIAVDSGGAAYVGGSTTSTNFPITSGAYQTVNGGSVGSTSDAFVTKLNAAGTALAYSTFLGGSGSEGADALCLSSGKVYVAGTTNSTNFPTTTGAFRRTLSGGYDGFVTGLNTTGAGLLLSTYIGGTGNDYLYGIGVDSAGAAHVTGFTLSTNMPVSTDALQTALSGTSDLYYAIVNSTGTALTYGTYFGGAAGEIGYALALDSSSKAYMVGRTDGAGMYTSGGAFQGAAVGNGDAFAVAFEPKTGVTLTVPSLTGYTGTTATLSATLAVSGASGLSGKTVAFTLDGTSLGSATTDASGLASVSYPISSSAATGTKTIRATYAGDTTYGVGYGAGTLTISKPVATVTVGNVAGYLGDYVTITATITGGGVGIANQILRFYINGASVDAVISNASGVGSTRYYLSATETLGSKTILVVSDGDATWPSARGSASLTVSKRTTTLTGTDVAGSAGTAVTLSATLIDNTGARIGYRSVAFTVNGTAAGSATTSSGVATLSYTIPAGTAPGQQTIGLSFAGDSYFTGSTGSATLTISKPATVLTGADAAGEIGAAVTLSATLTAGGAALSGRTVAFAVGGTSAGSATTNASGVATVSYTIPAGASAGPQTIDSSFAGDATYAASTGAGTLTVNKITTALAAADKAGEIGATVTLTATLTAGGSGVSGKTVAFTVGGASAGSATTNGSGVASLSYAIPAGASAGPQTIGAGFTADATHAASSATATLTVNKITTALAVTPITGEIGATVTLSATLTAGGSGVANKTIAFTVGGSPAGSGTTNASGFAMVSYTISGSASVGTQTIGAAFTTDATHTGSTNTGTLTITKISTDLGVYDAEGAIGATVTLSALLTAGGSGVPGKTVAFTVGGVAAGSGITDASGLATLSYTIPGSATAGVTSIGGAFAGDATYTDVTNSGSLTITRRTTSLAVAGAAGEIGAAVTLSATLTSSGAGVSGKTVAFTVAGASAGSGTTDGSGVATVSYTIPGGASAGPQTIRATFSTDGAYLGSTNTGTLTVNKITTALAAADKAGEIGATVTLTATLTAGGSGVSGKTVAFTVGGTSAGSATTNGSGVASLSYAIPAGASAGPQTIGASFTADATHAASSASATLTVSKRTTTLAVASLTARIGRTATLTATLTANGSGLAGKTVAITVDALSVGSAVTDASGVATVAYSIASGTALGAHSIAAAFAEDADSLPSDGSGTLTVQAAARATRVYVAPKSVAIGGTVILTAELFDATQSAVKLAGKTISFKVDGVDAGSAVTTAGSGNGMQASVSYTASGLSEGAHTILATFAADADYEGSSGSAALTVGKVSTTLTAADITATRGATIALRATLARTGGYVSGATLTFKVDSVSVGTATTGANGAASVNLTLSDVGGFDPGSIGTHTLTAEFAGDATLASSTATNTLTVNANATNLYVAPKAGAIGAGVILSATLYAGSTKLDGKSLLFAIDGTSVGSATSSAGVATLSYTIPEALGAGAHTISVAFAGDADYAATSNTAALDVAKAATTITASDIAAARGAAITLKATLTRMGGYISGATLTFKVDGTSVGTGTTSASGVATLSYTATAAIGAHTLTTEFAGDAANEASSATKTLTVNANATRLYVAPRTGAIGSPVIIGASLFAGSTKLNGKTIEFAIDGTSIGSATSAAGLATITITIPDALGTGAHTILASFAGDADYASATGVGTLDVAKATARIDVTSVTVKYGLSTTLKAVLIRPDGYMAGKSLTFTVNGTGVGSATTDAAGRATLSYKPTQAVGSYTLTVDFAGDATNQSATASSTLSISRARSRIYVPTVRKEYYDRALLGGRLFNAETGEAVSIRETLNVTVGPIDLGGCQTGDVLPGMGVLPVQIPDTLSLGANTVTVTFAGDTEFAGSTGTGTLIIDKATTKLIGTSPRVRTGASATLAAALSSAGGAAAGRTVTFTVNGTAVGSATTGADGKATLSYTVSLPAGSYPIVASFSGDAILKPTTGAATLTVIP